MSESTQSPSELLNNASEMQDVTVCENGCVRVFPRKTASGMCQRCKRINVEGLSAEEKQRISEMPQCTTCGVVSAYFLYKNPYTCGPCYDALNGITPRSTTQPFTKRNAVAGLCPPMGSMPIARTTTTSLTK
ncbi:hypothetical protein MPER_01484 [Moniliophthora perniciosa FA553]|nr:hypothetical protein MPER_01484 [Moniliophthora perniciosa FA553]